MELRNSSPATENNCRNAKCGMSCIVDNDYICMKYFAFQRGRCSVLDTTWKVKKSGQQLPVISLLVLRWDRVVSIKIVPLYRATNDLSLRYIDFPLRRWYREDSLLMRVSQGNIIKYGLYYHYHSKIRLICQDRSGPYFNYLRKCMMCWQALCSIHQFVKVNVLYADVWHWWGTWAKTLGFKNIRCANKEISTVLVFFYIFGSLWWICHK